MSLHTFDTRHAAAHGVNAAVLLQHLTFWITKNRADRRHQHEDADGVVRTWTYTSVRALAELFEYLSVDQIRYALGKLVDADVLLTGNYNKSAQDRTIWYALTDEECHLGTVPDAFGKPAKSIREDSQIHSAKSPNHYQIETQIETTDGVAAAARAREVLERMNRDCAAPAVVAEAESVVDASHAIFAADGEGLARLARAALCLGNTGAVPDDVRTALRDLDAPARAALLVAVLRTGETPRTGPRARYLLTLAPSIHADDARSQFTDAHGSDPALDSAGAGRARDQRTPYSGRPIGTAAERASTRTVAGIVGLLDKYPERGADGPTDPSTGDAGSGVARADEQRRIG